MRKSLLPEAGENLFQRVKKQCADAEAQGTKLFKISIGQPEGPAILEACVAAAHAVLSREESMHEYQDNTCHGVSDFARRFVQCHVESDLTPVLAAGNIDFLPIPGIKPMLGVVIASLGSWVGYSRRVGTMTKPGYPTSADQCQYIRGIDHISLPLREE